MVRVKPPPEATARVAIRLPPKLLKKAEDFAAIGKEKLPDLIRRAIAKEIGEPNLAECRGPGRPKKT